MINQVTLLGHLGADPEIRRTQDGRPIANLRMATSESWRDRNTGERRERTEWHRVVIFNEALAKVAEQYLKKGSKVYVQGQLATRKWEDQNGVERYTTEVVLPGFNSVLKLLDKREGSGPGFSDDAEAYGTTRTRDAGPRDAGPPPGDRPLPEDFDDEIPF